MEPVSADNIDISDTFEWHDGLPTPRWDVIWARIESVEPEARLGILMTATRQWLEELGRAFDGEYAIDESDHFLVLAPRADGTGPHLLGFAAKCRESLRLVLEELADFDSFGKPVVVLPKTREEYYRYICRYYPEGEHGGSGGVHIREGYPHVVLHGPELWDLENTLAHEFTHVALHHLAMPAWLEEGLAQMIEHQMTGGLLLEVDLELAHRHKRYWGEHGLDSFWSGEGFSQADEVQELSYELAEILVRLLVEGSRPRRFGRAREPRRRFLAFLRNAAESDHGEASCREHLGYGIADLAAQFLGPGRA